MAGLARRSPDAVGMKLVALGMKLVALGINQRPSDQLTVREPRWNSDPHHDAAAERSEDPRPE